MFCPQPRKPPPNLRVADQTAMALSKPGRRATLLDMRATINLPEPVFQILKARAEQRSLSIQAVILEAIKKEIAHGPTPVEAQGRVSLPLIRSGRPGSLHSLTNAEIDDILG
jgi:hypothetical protein